MIKPLERLISNIYRGRSGNYISTYYESWEAGLYSGFNSALGNYGNVFANLAWITWTRPLYQPRPTNLQNDPYLT